MPNRTMFVYYCERILCVVEAVYVVTISWTESEQFMEQRLLIMNVLLLMSMKVRAKNLLALMSRSTP
jgi:hypothetical protein